MVWLKSSNWSNDYIALFASKNMTSVLGSQENANLWLIFCLSNIGRWWVCVKFNIEFFFNFSMSQSPITVPIFFEISPICFRFHFNIMILPYLNLKRRSWGPSWSDKSIYSIFLIFFFCMCDSTSNSWWCHGMRACSALLAIYEGNVELLCFLC